MKKKLSIILLFCLSYVLGQVDRTPIEGEYLHKYGDNETLNQANAFCKDMALRNAVESQQIFVSSISELKNFELTKDMIRSLSAGYIEDLKIVEERVDKINNEIYYKISAYIRPEEFREAIKKETRRFTSIKNPKSILRGAYLEIMNITESKRNGLQYVDISYKKLGSRYENGDKYIKSNLQAYPSLYSNTIPQLSNYNMIDYIIIEWYDNNGNVIGGDKNETVMELSPNEYNSTSFYKPKEATDFSVRVTKNLVQYHRPSSSPSSYSPSSYSSSSYSGEPDLAMIYCVALVGWILIMLTE